MTTLSRLLLNSQTPFHFGKRGVGLNETEVTLPADALFSAFCYAYAALKGAESLQALLTLFPHFGKAGDQPPPFRITSLMPTVNGIDLLPMPMLSPRLTTDAVAFRKQLKAIEWVSKSIFQALVAGQSLAEDSNFVDLRAGTTHPYTVQAGAIWVNRQEYEQLEGADTTLWQVDTRPRVTVDRITSASTAFSSGAIHFANTAKLKVSLYALIRWEAADPALQQVVQQVFTALGQSGIGGERSYGYGQFTPHFTTISDDLGVANGAYFTTLSPYLPQPIERTVLAKPARYAIVLRRGWMSHPGYSNLRRPTVRMIDTGAVLHQPTKGNAVGGLADVTPTILQEQGTVTIYRYGLAWPVPVAAAALEEKH